ncbi:hypothetical protein [Novosphingobium sp. PC22D]|uniref:hypothetical protein n=1 Tax=Novosphingobium sp. PC22D TaxID=1962403 RepID=UPI00143A2E07|nr:hypothetical protein [Novosphingobium sp. PC22D]
MTADAAWASDSVARANKAASNEADGILSLQFQAGAAKSFLAIPNIQESRSRFTQEEDRSFEISIATKFERYRFLPPFHLNAAGQSLLGVRWRSRHHVARPFKWMRAPLAPIR